MQVKGVKETTTEVPDTQGARIGIGDPCPCCSPDDFLAEVSARYVRALLAAELEDPPLERLAVAELNARRLVDSVRGDVIGRLIYE